MLPKSKPAVQLISILQGRHSTVAAALWAAWKEAKPCLSGSGGIKYTGTIWDLCFITVIIQPNMTKPLLIHTNSC